MTPLATTPGAVRMRVEVPAASAGRRVDQVLGEVAQIGSRSHAERLLRDGLVTINGRPAGKSSRLRAGDHIDIDDAGLAEPEPVTFAAPNLTMPYQDDHIVVVDKPAGMVVHPAPGLHEATLVEVLSRAGVALAAGDDERFERPGVVHRLDKDTSGVIVLAKSPAALRTMQAAIRQRLVRREYIALVKGRVPSRAGRIEAPIGRDVRDPARQSIDTDAPRDATTHFVVTEMLPTTTLLRIRLETGRTHQIRVHMQAIGHPVAGDTVYADGSEFELGRQFLHAAQLSFPHPVTEAPIDVVSPLPQDLLDALAIARRA